MKIKIISTLMILLMFSSINLMADMEKTSTGEKAAKETDEKYKDEIDDLLKKYTLEKFSQQLIFEARISQLKEKEQTANIFAGIIKLGLGYWGLSKNNAYSNITGGIFALSGTLQLLQINW